MLKPATLLKKASMAGVFRWNLWEILIIGFSQNTCERPPLNNGRIERNESYENSLVGRTCKMTSQDCSCNNVIFSFKNHSLKLTPTSKFSDRFIKIIRVAFKKRVEHIISIECDLKQSSFGDSSLETQNDRNFPQFHLL